MTRKYRKILTVLLSAAMVMVFSFAFTSTSFATDYPNITKTTDTAYTTQVTSTSTPANLYVTRASSDYQTTAPFATASDAANVTWSYPYGGSGNFTITSSAEATTGGYYAKLAVVKTSGATTGAYSIRATYGTATMDFTLVIPYQSSTSRNVKVYIDGSSTVDTNTFTTTNSSVTAAGSIYNYATPMTALNGMISSTPSTSMISAISTPYSPGYVNSITGYQGGTTATTKAANTISGCGWQYRVYDYTESTGVYTLNRSSEIIGADAMKIVNNDAVIWYYGTYDNANTYFNGLTSAQITALFN